ncbi:MAG: hypothetical protein NZ900_09665 [Synergistetes bacterium]|nr:hypothetical protein [Synergistota bacterium]MDW8193181.1 hypothetical protein [Synergistota bacterium]
MEDKDKLYTAILKLTSEVCDDVSDEVKRASIIADFIIRSGLKYKGIFKKHPLLERVAKLIYYRLVRSKYEEGYNS